MSAELPALREWRSNCDAIEAGRQVLLIRKGGIAEGSEGFAVDAHRFAFLPTLFHQKHGTPSTEPIEVRVVGELVRAVEVPSDTPLGVLAAFHAYDPEQLATRVRYKPERPLTLMAIRAFRLRAPRVFSADVVRPVCRSWLSLPVDPASLELEPVASPLSLDELQAALRRIEAAASSGHR